MLALGSLVAPACAQDGDPRGNPEAEAPAAPAEEVADDLHDRRVDYQGDILVSATGLAQLDLLAGTSVFEAEDIQSNLNGQIGEVLAKLPGVSATSFSPGASRPVLRGFQGERVRVLIDGLGTADASNTSADHATAIDPLTAERIEVLRGPAVLLYGSQAIGGAVNVIDKRIPRRVPDEAFHVDGLAGWNSAYDLREGGASLDVPLAARLVIHADGSYRETNDLEIGGFVFAPMLRAELLEAADGGETGGDAGAAAELRETAGLRGVLPGSSTRSWTANAGAAFIDGENTLGVAVGWYDTRYGVPERPGIGGEEAVAGGEEGVSIDLEQFRADLRGELALGAGLFSRLKTRVGYSDYTHTEFEGDAVGTVFDVEGIEARLELVQNERSDWRGSIGGQYFYRDFLAVGEEAFIAPNITNQYALFALQEFGEGPLQIEAGARFEATDVEAPTLDLRRSFSTFSTALGLVHEATDTLRVGINLSRAERAPGAEELYSNGPHVATQGFEIGDPDLRTESANGIEGFARGRLGGAEFSVAVFRNWFDNFVYLSETGTEEDGLPVFQYLQDNATHFGIEGEVTFPLHEQDGFKLIADLRGDYLRASLDDGTPLPRIPPVSLLGALEAQTGAFDARAEVQWFSRQDRVTSFETETDGFTLVNLSLTWHPIKDDRGVALVLGADNLFDVTARRHASFTKDFVPLAGRNVKASARFSF